MRNLLIISLLLLGNYGYGQEKDTLKLYWNNSNIKYIEYYASEFIEEIDGSTNWIIFLNEHYHNMDGNLISSDDFITNYGIEDFNALRKERDDLFDKLYPKNETYVDKYKEFIKAADNFFFEKNYIKSIENYKLALELRPKEEYPINQLKKLEKLK